MGGPIAYLRMSLASIFRVNEVLSKLPFPPPPQQKATFMMTDLFAG